METVRCCCNISDMKNWIVYILCLLFPFSIYGKGDKEFTVLQWNIWQEGTVVEGGYEAIVNEIVRLKPDFVTFSEVRNYNQTRFCDRIVQSLSQKGETYYSFYSNDSGYGAQNEAYKTIY